MLTVKDLSVSYGRHLVVDRLSFTLAEKQWLMIVGPNGAGKSSLIKAICQELAYLGQVLFNDRDLAKSKPAALARQIGVLSQHRLSYYNFTVEEVVRLGRYAYSKGPFASRTPADEEKIEEALTATGLNERRRQSMLNLSGGELQRTFLAQVLAQDPQVLLLDEPTNHLDLQYQRQILDLIQAWRQRTGRSVMAVVHDLSLAALYGSEVLLLDQGKKIALGEAKQVLSRDYLQQVYGLDVYAWMQNMLSVWQ